MRMSIFDIFKKKENKKRRVMLVMHDKDLRPAVAMRTQAGWRARWIDSSDQWSILLPNGAVYGTTLVKGWLPESGWDGTEFEGHEFKLPGAG